MTQQRLTKQIEEQKKELKEPASQDALTDILTAQLLLQFGEQELVQSQHFGRPLSAIVFDVDHFRRIAAAYGEPGCDRVLRELAAVVQNRIRPTDLFARSDGAKFVLLLPATNLAAACHFAEGLRQAIANSALAIDQVQVRVTISLGVAAIPGETRRLADLLSAADHAMNKAKQAGRNRIFFVEDRLARHFYHDLLLA